MLLDQIKDMLSLLRLCLRTRQNVDQITERDEERDRAHHVRETLDRKDTLRKEQNQRYGHNGNDAEHRCDCRLPRLRRQRVVGFRADRPKHHPFQNQVEDRAERRHHRAERKGRVVTADQGNGACDARNHRTDVRDYIGNRERTVAALIALRIHFAGQGVERSAGDHATKEQEPHRERVTRNSESRNREDNVGNRQNQSVQTQRAANAEDTVRHVAADCAEQNDQRVKK